MYKLICKDCKIVLAYMKNSDWKSEVANYWWKYRNIHLSFWSGTKNTHFDKYYRYFHCAKCLHCICRKYQEPFMMKSWKGNNVDNNITLVRHSMNMCF